MAISSAGEERITHREEEVVRIITPMAVHLVEQTVPEASASDKTELSTELVVTFLEDLDGQLDIPCDGPYCSICGLCAF